MRNGSRKESESFSGICCVCMVCIDDVVNVFVGFFFLGGKSETGRREYMVV